MRLGARFLLVWILLLVSVTELYSSYNQNIYDDNKELFGKQLVQRYFPPLVEAVESIAPHIGNSFFEGWTESDLLLFLKTIEATGDKTNRVLKEDIGPDISGVLTNIFGNIELRRRYPSSRGFGFASELVLDRAIKYLDKAECLERLDVYCRRMDISTSRHDGIVYRWENGRFVIYEVLESKVDGKYKARQGWGVLDRWKNAGIFLGGYHIPTNSIYLRDKETDRLIHINDVGRFYFRTYTFLSLSKGVALHANDNRGERFLVPFSDMFVTNRNRVVGSPGFFYVIADRLVDVLPKYHSVLKRITFNRGGRHVSSAVISGFFKLYLKELAQKAEYVVRYRIGRNNEVIYSVSDEALFLYSFVVPFYLRPSLIGLYLEKLLPYNLFDDLIYADSCEDFFSIDF